MRNVLLALIASVLTVGGSASADAKSCSDVRATCLRVYAAADSGMKMNDPATGCRNNYNSCLSTGVWQSGQTVIKGLAKK